MNKEYFNSLVESDNRAGEMEVKAVLTVVANTRDDAKNALKTILEQIKKEEKEEKTQPTRNETSIYARFFDETCKYWDRSKEYNHIFLKTQENYFNDILNVRGHVFLNEVYDALGIERTRAGQMVGWIKGAPDGGHISFGLKNPCDTILLDFNVDGNIFDIL